MFESCYSTTVHFTPFCRIAMAVLTKTAHVPDVPMGND